MIEVYDFMFSKILIMSFFVSVSWELKKKNQISKHEYPKYYLNYQSYIKQLILVHQICYKLKFSCEDIFNTSFKCSFTNSAFFGELVLVCLETYRSECFL